MTKAIVKICYKLAIVCHSRSQVKSIFDKMASWPQLIAVIPFGHTCLLACCF